MEELSLKELGTRIKAAHLELTDEERDILFAAVNECEHDVNASDLKSLLQRLHFLKQHLKALFSRAHIT